MSELLIQALSWVIYAVLILGATIVVVTAFVTMFGISLARRNNIPIHWKKWPLRVEFDGVTMQGQRVQFYLGKGKLSLLKAKPSD